jgi:hypothetical protein
MKIHVKGKKRHDSVLREQYGIGLHQYEQMFKDQSGECFICGNSEDRNLAVDHCHKTGAVRRLLCQKCNRGLGMFNDDPSMLKKAAWYVEQSFDLPEDREVETIPHAKRARWRNIVTTPKGVFTSFAEAGKAYNVDPTTIGAWCGTYSMGDRYKKEGFSFEKVFK